MSRFKLKGWFRWLVHLPGGRCAGGLSSILLLLFSPRLLKRAVGFLVSLYLLAPEFAQLCLHAVIFSAI